MGFKKSVGTLYEKVKAVSKEQVSALREGINAQFGTDAVLDRSTYWAILISLTIFFLMFSVNAHADTDGATLWGQFKGLFFGPYGLLIGALMFCIAAFGFFRNGLGWSSMIVGLIAIFFLIPGLTKAMQTFASTVAA